MFMYIMQIKRTEIYEFSTLKRYNQLLIPNKINKL